jgi:hypothetical protein
LSAGGTETLPFVALVRLTRNVSSASPAASLLLTGTEMVCKVSPGSKTTLPFVDV